MKSISLIIGSGFSVPDGMRTVGQINDLLINLKENDIYIQSDMTFIWLNGQEKPSFTIQMTLTLSQFLQKKYIFFLLRYLEKSNIQTSWKVIIKAMLKPIIALCLLLIVCSLSFAQDMSKFLSLGDSYTYGESVPDSENLYVQLYEAINKAYTWTEPTDIDQTGWRTDDLLKAISEAKPDNNYDFATLLIGVNNQYQGRPFSQYENEFITLLDSAIFYAQNDPNRVFVLSIPDYYFTPFGQEQKGEWVSEELDTYNAYAKSICDSMQVSFIDITPISRRGIKEPKLVANDGLHPSGMQYKLWIEKLLKEMSRQGVL